MGGVYQPQLDGLRALAIMGVLFHHFGLHIPEFFEYGPIGVRLFFALTGFFITMWLWQAQDAAARGGLSPWREVPVFHARRLLRLVPPLYLSLLLAVLFGVDKDLRDFLWHVLFASNFYIAKLGYWPPDVSHLWSLSVQEQFYLLWPVLILLTPRRWFLALLVIMVTMAFGYRLGCILVNADPLVRWIMLPGTLDSFAIGAFIAWVSRGRLGAKMMSEKTKWSVGIVAFLCLLVARWIRYFPQSNPWIATIELWEAVFISWVIAGTAQGWKGPAGRFLSLPPLVYIGKISLGIYLFHVLVHIVLGPRLDAWGIDISNQNTLRVMLLCLTSIAVAALSWHFLEKPLARYKPAMLFKKS
jgi:peptidoglycan/LPS O-acetylase OafA/YrhL